MQIATLGSNHYFRSMLEIDGDTCDLTFTRQQIFVKNAAVMVQLSFLIYNITGSSVVLYDFAWQKCMLDDGRLLELSEPNVWALFWLWAQHIPVWNRSHISERNPVFAFRSSTVCWSSLA